MSKVIEDQINKAFEGLMPGLTDIIQNRNFKVDVERVDEATVRFTAGGAPYVLSDDILEQLKMMINITSLMDAKTKQSPTN